ncbi:hypothetical protein AB0L50_03805 [Streptomyces flaveolus]|uniref:hypothetical protein n=1 Tax=Streptomyces flaveolus TaxID=67297 RepID=UPI00341ECB33
MGLLAGLTGTRRPDGDVVPRHEVRFLDERWETRPSGDARAQYGRGTRPPCTGSGRRGGPDGRRHKAEAFRFETREMTDPLRDTVLGAGWTWRGVFRL